MTQPSEPLAHRHLSAIHKRHMYSLLDIERGRIEQSRNVDDIGHLLAEVDRLRAELAALRAVVRSTAASLRDTAERAEQGRTVDAASLRAQATALDDITNPMET